MKIETIKLNKTLTILELSRIVQVASCFNGEIKLIFEEEEISLKKILPLINTKLSKNDIIEIQIKGDRENEFYESLMTLMNEILQED